MWGAMTNDGEKRAKKEGRRNKSTVPTKSYNRVIKNTPSWAYLGNKIGKWRTRVAVKTTKIDGTELL